MPTVSVIIPTYNRAAMVKEAIQSVLDQTYSDYEIIVVDDGSTDNTREVIGEFSEKVRYVYQENRGRSHARNHALRLAQGRYIAFLDSDDLFMPHKLETQVMYMDKYPEYGMVYSSCDCIDEYGKELPSYYKATSSGWIYAEIAFGVPLTIILPTVMARAEVISQVGGFDDKMERFEDTDMWRRVSRHFRILAIPEPLCKVRTHADNKLTNQDIMKIIGAIDLYVAKVFREDSDQGRLFLRRAAARLYRKYGVPVALIPEWRNFGRKLLLRSIIYWPFDPYAHSNLLEALSDKRSFAFVMSLVLRVVRFMYRLRQAVG